MSGRPSALDAALSAIQWTVLAMALAWGVHAGLSCSVDSRCRAEENCSTLRAVASIWQDHPDYREEWKP